MHVGGLFYFPITRNTRLSVLVLKGLSSSVSFYLPRIRTRYRFPPISFSTSFFLQKPSAVGILKIPARLNVNFSHERVRARTHRRRSFDHRHREVGITTTGGGGARARYYTGVDGALGLVPSTVVTRDGGMGR